MAKFVELAYKINGKKFFVNPDSIANVQGRTEDSTIICSMPHFETEPETDPEFVPPPFVAIVEGGVDEVIAKLNG